MIRGFEKISSRAQDASVIIPKRATAASAGYDIHTPTEITIQPSEIGKIKTGIKAYMQKDEVLQVYVRSSIGIKKNLTLANQVGIVDSDYYNNPSNEGELIIALRNNNTKTITLPAGERIAQGVFAKFLTTDKDIVMQEKREGGIGSTGTN